MEDKIILKFKTKNILNFYEIEPWSGAVIIVPVQSKANIIWLVVIRATNTSPFRIGR